MSTESKPALHPLPRIEGETRTRRHALLGHHADLQIELHYGDFGTGAGHEAAVYVTRRDASGTMHGVFVPLSQMWMYVQGKGGQFNESFAEMIPPLCRHLYGIVTRSGMMNVMDAIIDYLDDLRKSPIDTDFLQDRTLKAFLDDCNKAELEFWVEIGGKRTVLN